MGLDATHHIFCSPSTVLSTLCVHGREGPQPKYQLADSQGGTETPEGQRPAVSQEKRCVETSGPCLLEYATSRQLLAGLGTANPITAPKLHSFHGLCQPPPHPERPQPLSWLTALTPHPRHPSSPSCPLLGLWPCCSLHLPSCPVSSHIPAKFKPASSRKPDWTAPASLP